MPNIKRVVHAIDIAGVFALLVFLAASPLVLSAATVAWAQITLEVEAATALLSLVTTRVWHQACKPHLWDCDFGPLISPSFLSGFFFYNLERNFLKSDKFLRFTVNNSGFPGRTF
jgi:hypothetical protein